MVETHTHTHTHAHTRTHTHTFLQSRGSRNTLNLPNNPREGCSCYLHSVDAEIGTQKRHVTCPRSQGRVGFEPMAQTLALALALALEHLQY